jgi:hypothetical protein
MKETTTATKPRLFRSGKPVPVDILIADPSITVIEAGKALGFLLAESCYDNANGDLVLDTVTWVRCAGKGAQRLTSHSLKQVAVYRHSAGPFVAQDTTSKHYLSQPSLEPYFIAFITKEQYEEIARAIDKSAPVPLLDLIVPHIDQLPGFSFDRATLVVPPGYARAATGDLEYDVIAV